MSRFLLSSLLLSAAFLGCNRNTPASANTRADAAQQTDDARQQMSLIPPPTKSRYMAVKSLTGWSNPSITVQGGMLTLHVMTADGNTSHLGEGGLLRPVDARRLNLNIRINDLPTALNAVPQEDWPYGRVIAVEEAHNIPADARPQVRRNMEAAVRMLSDLGVVVYEWTDGGPALR